MNESPDSFPWETDDAPLMGPAVPHQEEAPTEDSLDAPLPPFLAGASDAEPATDEIPWLVPEGEEMVGIDELQSADLGADATAAESFAPQAPEAPEPVEWAAPLDDLPGTDPLSVDHAEAPLPGVEADAPARPDDLAGATAGSGAATGAAGDAAGQVAGDVADRLEQIAHSLRTRDPSGILGSASDPLEVLIVGYVLGYSRAERQR